MYLYIYICGLSVYVCIWPPFVSFIHTYEHILVKYFIYSAIYIYSNITAFWHHFPGIIFLAFQHSWHSWPGLAFGCCSVARSFLYLVPLKIKM